MPFYNPEKRRRLFVVWIATVAICGAAVLAAELIDFEGARLLSVDVASGLAGASYVAAAVMCVTTIRWFKSAPKRTELITVHALRKRGRMPR